MIASKNLENAIAIYDLYHAGTLLDKIVSVDISFNNVIKIKISDSIKKDSLDLEREVFPRFLIHILSKNKTLSCKINKENIILESRDKLVKIIIRNANDNVTKAVESYLSILNNERLDIKDLVDLNGPSYVLVRYVVYGVILDYARYRKNFLDDTGKINFFDLYSSKSYLDPQNRLGELNLKDLVALELARNAFALGFYTPINNDLFEYLENEFSGDSLVKDVCDMYEKSKLDEDNICTNAFMCAQYEELNSSILVNNKDVVLEALEAIRQGISYNDDRYLDYFKNKEKYYELIGNDKLKNICFDFINSCDLVQSSKGDTSMKDTKNSLVGEIKKIKKNDFKDSISNPIEMESLFKDEEHDLLALEGEEQAKLIMNMIRERDELKKNAEEFARTILQKQKENKEILAAADEQARKIVALQKENEELKRMAEENARFIYEHDSDGETSDSSIDELIRRIEARLREIDENEETYSTSDSERENIKAAAREYAQRIFAAEKERDELKVAAREQAVKIFNLQKENDELKRMAEENAKFIYNKEKDADREINIEELVKRIETRLREFDENEETYSSSDSEKEKIKAAAREYAEQIYNKQKENEQLKDAARIQAQQIFALQQENTNLKRMAEENAWFIFNKDKEENRSNSIDELVRKIETKLKEIDDSEETYATSNDEADKIKAAAREYAEQIYNKQKESERLVEAARAQAERIIALEQENEKLKKLAEENAKVIFDSERKEIKRDADEYARLIFEKQEERKTLLKAAESQAMRIIALERENDELKRLAKENAKNIFDRENRYREEISLREELDNTPISSSDIDKIYELLNALTAIEELDFAINHPTAMQLVNELEEKINTYLSTHQNITDGGVTTNTVTDHDREELPLESIDVIRNAYVESLAYAKEGRHSVINIEEVDGRYKVTLYSVKDDNDDVLTESFFEKEFFNEEVIKDICEIFKKDAVIVASKIDNIPDGYQDYLVIDNLENAIKFMGIKKELVEIAKKYL